MTLLCHNETCHAELNMGLLRERFPRLYNQRIDRLKCPKCSTRLEVGREDMAAFTPHDLDFLKAARVGV